MYLLIISVGEKAEEELLKGLEALLSALDASEGQKVTENLIENQNVMIQAAKQCYRTDLSTKEFIKCLLRACMDMESKQVYEMGLTALILLMTKYPEEMAEVEGANEYLRKIIVAVSDHKASRKTQKLLWTYIQDPSPDVDDAHPYVEPALKASVEELLKQEFEELFTATQEPFGPCSKEDHEKLENGLKAVRYFDKAYRNGYALNLELYKHHNKLLKDFFQAPNVAMIKQAEYHWMRVNRYGAKGYLKREYKLADDFEKGSLDFAGLLLYLITQHGKGEGSFLNNNSNITPLVVAAKAAFPELDKLV